MKKFSTRSREYKALSALHEDLQKGKGNWHIFMGHSNDPRSPAYTQVVAHGTAGMADFSLSIGRTMIDESKLKGLRAMTMISEGGIYEMGTGRAGSEAREQITNADAFATNEAQRERNIDNVVNALFNRNLGVEDDD